VEFGARSKEIFCNFHYYDGELKIREIGSEFVNKIVDEDAAKS
jgi:DNA replicative helicase MCM subunit Mcm2 (Cdc46/Mcm family)